MAKAKTNYTCTECGASEPKWQGQCPSCLAWNTLVETVPEAPSANRYAALAQTTGLQKLKDVEAAEVERQPSGISEFDRVLGGGFVAGGVVLIGGDPGIGKSTLLLQTLCHVGKAKKALYVSGEESAQQIAMRAKRLSLDASPIDLLAEIQLEKILATLQNHKPDIAVIDSIQTVYSEALQSAPGSVAQVRECSAQLTRVAKQLGISVILVGHVTKEGSFAGPRVLEHIVDTVLYFEGDPNSSFRLIRAFKNRFGAVNELGVFAMTEKGLREVSNPSALFLSHHAEQVAGSCITVTQEGTRPLLIEIQALVDEAHAPNPKRLCVGLEQNRLAMLLAVLHRHAGVACFDQDVFINAVGGVKIAEPGVDLAILMSITSSLKNKSLASKLIVFGEVGLAGEVRPVQRGQERLKEAAKLGFTHAIVPKSNAPKQPIKGLTVYAVERIDQAIQRVREIGVEGNMAKRVLFIHQNFPGQFLHIAQHLQRDSQFEVMAICQPYTPKLPNVKTILYKPARLANAETHHYIRPMETHVLNGQAVTKILISLKQSGYSPDVVIAHTGWGEALFVKDVFPNAHLIGFFEFYYRAFGEDTGFDPEFPLTVDDVFRIRCKNSTHLLSLEAVDSGVSPTQWQLSTLPKEFAHKMVCIHEGIDTEHAQPDDQAELILETGYVLTNQDEIVTFVARNLEPYRGFHVFMRSLKGLLERRPRLHVLIVGGDDVSYGRKPSNGQTWREKMLSEVGLDSDRVHFLGRVLYSRYLNVLQVSSVHVYLTVPFVLSWSLLEAMSVGCAIVASDTPPVSEVIRHNENGMLVDFFSIQAIQDSVTYLLEHRNEALRLGLQAQKEVRERYTHRQGIQGYLKLMKAE